MADDERQTGRTAGQARTAGRSRGDAGEGGAPKDSKAQRRAEAQLPQTRRRGAEGDPRGADLRVARAADAEGDLQAARHRAEGRRAGGARGAEAGLRAAAADCSSSKSPAAIRSSRGRTCTSGCAGCSTSARTQKLTVQALETLAVIAYRQPITAAEITEIRGVNTSGVLNTLLERHLIKIVGRKQVVGRPFLYATTKEFLIRFGLNDLERPAEGRGHGRSARLRRADPDRADAARGDAAARGARGRRTTDDEPSASDSSLEVAVLQPDADVSAVACSSVARSVSAVLRRCAALDLVCSSARASRPVLQPRIAMRTDRDALQVRRPDGRSRRTCCAPGGCALRES